LRTTANTVLKEAAVTAFKQSLRGPLIAPGDDSYAEARQIWNGDIDRRPSLIARPVGVADVIQAVRGVCLRQDGTTAVPRVTEEG
jgi:hypothetical protein